MKLFMMMMMMMMMVMKLKNVDAVPQLVVIVGVGGVGDLVRFGVGDVLQVFDEDGDVDDVPEKLIMMVMMSDISCLNAKQGDESSNYNNGEEGCQLHLFEVQKLVGPS